MCNASLRGIMLRAALAAAGSVGFAVCMHIAPLVHLDGLATDSQVLTFVERDIPAAASCVFHTRGSDHQPDGFSACAESVLHATRAFASDNGSAQPTTAAAFDNHAR
jgi:hypothetical protein